MEIADEEVTKRYRTRKTHVGGLFTTTLRFNSRTRLLTEDVVLESDHASVFDEALSGSVLRG